MPQLDKIKEEIGWLKVAFALLVAIDVSLIGWLSQNFFAIPVLMLLVSMAIVLSVTVLIIVLTHRAYKKIDDLGEM